MYYRFVILDINRLTYSYIRYVIRGILVRHELEEDTLAALVVRGRVTLEFPCREAVSELVIDYRRYLIRTREALAEVGPLCVAGPRGLSAPGGRSTAKTPRACLISPASAEPQTIPAAFSGPSEWPKACVASHCRRSEQRP